MNVTGKTKAVDVMWMTRKEGEEYIEKKCCGCGRKGEEKVKETVQGKKKKNFFFCVQSIKRLKLL